MRLHPNGEGRLACPNPLTLLLVLEIGPTESVGRAYFVEKLFLDRGMNC